MTRTHYLTVEPSCPAPHLIAEAAEVIRQGGLVAFPTETVYGLGADGLNKKAVARIFQAKGRPQENPLILHVASLEQARGLVSCWPPAAELLAKRFLPGPLTLILPRAQVVPDLVTAGLPTVALRYPANRVALDLITASGVPIAAPSANISGRPSPTRGEHVLADLEGKIEVILDGGPTEVGVESTILSLAGETPVLLRPGGITKEEIEQLLQQEIVVPDCILHPEELKSRGALPSPGLYFKHYAPRAQVIMVTGNPQEQVAKVKEYLAENPDRLVGVLATSENISAYQELNQPPFYLVALGSRSQPEEIANHLFGAFRQGDAHGAEVLLVETVAPRGVGLAVMNRLCRASGQHEI